MIALRLDKKSVENVNKAVSQKISAIDILKTNEAKEKIVSAAFAIATSQMLTDLSMTAKSNRKTFEELYDWTPSGININKLFVISRGQVSGHNLNVFINMYKSKHTPNPFKGQSVSVDSQSALSNEINIGELSVSNNTALPAEKEIHAAEVLKEFCAQWYESRSATVLSKSNMFPILSKELTKAWGDKNASAALMAKLSSITHVYSQGRTVF